MWIMAKNVRDGESWVKVYLKHLFHIRVQRIKISGVVRISIQPTSGGPYVGPPFPRIFFCLGVHGVG